jgi:hypothetical protein
MWALLCAAKLIGVGAASVTVHASVKSPDVAPAEGEAEGGEADSEVVPL